MIPVVFGLPAVVVSLRRGVELQQWDGNPGGASWIVRREALAFITVWCLFPYVISRLAVECSSQG